VRDEALVQLRLEHVIGKNPLVRHIEVRLRLAMRYVHVLPVLHAGWTRHEPLPVEAIHPAFCPQEFARAVARLEHRLRRVVDLVVKRQAHRLEQDRAPFRIFAARNGVCAGIALKEIVEAAVFLHDKDDVVDLPGTGYRARHRRHIT